MIITALITADNLEVEMCAVCVLNVMEKLELKLKSVTFLFVISTWKTGFSF